MIASGDVVVADLGGETRGVALVISNVRFHRTAGRAWIAPEFAATSTATPPPWHLRVDGRVFALDVLQSIPVERALDVIGQASAATMRSAHNAVLRIV
jgi:mRNA-degrading endonuclease toxin of MazEF toxin-antitoxin module